MNSLKLSISTFPWCIIFIITSFISSNNFLLFDTIFQKREINFVNQKALVNI